ncbi:hypothetical protein EYB25_008976 [Talaromyces marneffei]|uniref:uncharacterized protein n=1 Tax=Talaromyces marneffei TaxID=37727 RepID=UPI0012A83049|nr:uncharacterized protein EYB26_009652 [Talaromyces marneffei]KAE8548595.1 hypothetical protein EYB25_008976 [Talaromyces marneffei]QGA21938.1 hypothetical protein EYB26_009652 [Talaromyces marneffei]
MPPTRRNLFQSHLSRRPASNPPQPSTSDSNNHPSTDNNDSNNDDDRDIQNPPHQSNLMTPETRPINTITPQTDSGDIIARDKNGKFQLDIPVLPPVPLDEGDEEDDVEDEDEGAMEGIEEDGRPRAGPESMGKDKDKLEADLVEMMYRNRNRHLSGEPELLNLLQQSLRSKVATLEEDNWMFETEDDPLV